MNILVITSRDLEKGSTKYRIAQYTDYLDRQGVHCEFVRRKEIGSSLMNNIGEFDLVFNQKCLMNLSVSRKIFSDSRKTIFDFDDAIYTRPGKPRSFITTLRVKKRLHMWLQRADYVTTSSQYLADYARQYSSSVVVVPMGIDMEIWKPLENKPEEQITIGWAGSPGNIPNVERLEPVLSALLKKYTFLKLSIFSGAKPNLVCPFEYHPFRPGAEPAFVQGLDIGLLPLVGEEYSKGKSPIKAIQYLACSVPVVGDVLGATAEILNNKNSISVSSDKDWYGALEALALDRDMRQSMGRSGREFVLEHHNMFAVREQLLQLFSDEKKGVKKHGQPV